MMTSPSLANSPPDIILSIAEHLDLSTLCQLRLLSHEFDAQFSPLALRSIAFRLCNDEEKVKQLLDACSQPLPCIYRHAKHLTVKTSGWCVSRAVDSTRIADVYKTIERLEGLKSLKMVWEFGWDDSEATKDFVYQIQEEIVEAVLKVTGGTLNRLILKPKIFGPHRFALPTRLGVFKGLRELKIVFDKHGYKCSGLDMWGRKSEWYEEGDHDCKPEGYEEVLWGLVRNNRGLQVLKLQQGCGIKFNDAAEFFLVEDGESRLSSLHKLTLSGVKFSRDLGAQSSPFPYLQFLEVPSIYSVLPLDHL
ncbi:hypothetical protein AX16_006051 [Volvariella volvacea WC 439]|nr:hypothetical protein AX16_006051 [Volvariella volvacea WC 439]